MKTTILCICFLFSGSLYGFSQDNIVVAKVGQKKNIIHWNLTPIILWGVNSVVLSYERLIAENKSVVISAGYQEFPKYREVDEDEYVHLDYVERFGIRFSAEYRFYCL